MRISVWGYYLVSTWLALNLVACDNGAQSLLFDQSLSTLDCFAREDIECYPPDPNLLELRLNSPAVLDVAVPEALGIGTGKDMVPCAIDIDVGGLCNTGNFDSARIEWRNLTPPQKDVPGLLGFPRDSGPGLLLCENGRFQAQIRVPAPPVATTAEEVQQLSSENDVPHRDLMNRKTYEFRFEIIGVAADGSRTEGGPISKKKLTVDLKPSDDLLAAIACSN